jgi:hypothetical protein
MENTEHQTNRHFLPDGRSFIIDVTKESPEAWATKKAFIISIGEHELGHNKMFSAAVLRLLATGMIAVTENGKRKTKAELLEGFTALIAEARELGALRYDALKAMLADGGYSSERLDMMLSALSGDALVNAIEASLKGNGYADSSIVKTYLPDIYKAIKAYGGENAEDTIRLLKHRFSPTTKAVNAADDANVVEHSNSVRPVFWEPIAAFLDGLDIDSASWKHLSVFLALATGRRMAEIHGTATAFHATDNEHVMFTGQLKTKEREQGAEPYIIKTLADASRVVAAWERLKTLRAPLAPHDVNRKLSKPLSSEMPASILALYDASGILKYKDMRDIYAAKMLDDKPVTMTANAFVARCMGHGADDLSTANTYQKIRIASLSNEDAL